MTPEEKFQLEEMRRHDARRKATDALWKEAQNHLGEITALGRNQAWEKAVAELELIKHRADYVSKWIDQPTPAQQDPIKYGGSLLIDMLEFIINNDYGEIVIFPMEVDGIKFFYVRVSPSSNFRAGRWEDAVVKGFLWSVVVRKVREQVAQIQ
jgi:hypothetical protein